MDKEIILNQKADEILRGMIIRGLTNHPDLKNSQVMVEVKDHQVNLRGVVDDIYKKWLIEDYVADLFGVLSIRNSIEVRKVI